MRSIRIILAVFSAASLAARLEACAGGTGGAGAAGHERQKGPNEGAMAWADHRNGHPQDVPGDAGGCQVFPADNPWNTDISQAPVDPNSDNYMAAMHASTTNLHPDFGSNPHYGIPVTLAPASTPLVPMKFFLYPGQSDKGPYPFPPTARVEGGKRSHGDRHVLVVGEVKLPLVRNLRLALRRAGLARQQGQQSSTCRPTRYATSAGRRRTRRVCRSRRRCRRSTR